MFTLKGFIIAFGAGFIGGSSNDFSDKVIALILFYLTVEWGFNQYKMFKRIENKA